MCPFCHETFPQSSAESGQNNVQIGAYHIARAKRGQVTTSGGHHDQLGQFLFVKVDDKPEWDVKKFHVTQELGFVYGPNGLDRFGKQIMHRENLNVENRESPLSLFPPVQLYVFHRFYRLKFWKLLLSHPA
jgi:hypothetical protein